MEDRVNVIEVNSPQTDGPKKKGWKKGLLIFVIILVAIIAIGSISIALLGDSEEKGSLLIGDNGHISMHAPYVGELYVEGTIGGAAGGLLLGRVRGSWAARLFGAMAAAAGVRLLWAP